MNISKRLLRCTVALVAVAFGCKVLAAGLAVPLGETFESYAAGTKAATEITDWSGGLDDASEIVELAYDYEPEGEGISFPISGAAHTKVLKLNTEGGTLSAGLDTSSSKIDTQKLYIDTMTQFVLSEDEPSFGQDPIKLALYANANSNLVVRHATIDFEVAEPVEVVTNSTTTMVIDPEKWYRLSIAADYKSTEAGRKPHFQIRVDGVVVEHADAQLDNEWFLAVDGGFVDGDMIKAVAFQGTGYVDDIVVSRDDPFAPPNMGFNTVYTVVNGAGGIDKELEEDVDSGGSLTIVYTADPWNRIASLVVDGNPVGAAVGLKTYQQELTDIEDDVYNVVTFEAATAAQVGLPSGVDPAWAAGFYTEEQALADTNLADDYLLGLNPTGDYDIALTITSIVVGDDNVTVTVLLTDDEEALKTTLNGSLLLYGKENLSDQAWSAVGGAEIIDAVFDENGAAVFNEFVPGNYKFFKAVIEPTVVEAE